MCSPSLLMGLNENILSLSEKWAELAKLLDKKISAHDDGTKILDTLENLHSNPFQVEWQTPTNPSLIISLSYVSYFWFIG